MSIYIGNDLEDRLKALEVENSLLKKYNEYHQVVHEIDHMSNLHVDSSFYKQSMKINNYFNPINPGLLALKLTLGGRCFPLLLCL